MSFNADLSSFCLGQRYSCRPRPPPLGTPQTGRYDGVEPAPYLPMPDHVHIFLSAPPKVAPTVIAKILKGSTARTLFTKHPELKQRLWGGHLWNPSYYVGTAGNVSGDTIRRYIESQKTRE